MAKLTMEKAKEILKKHVTEAHLFTHAEAVSAAMGAMAEHFGEDKAHWEAIGYLHDVDFEKYPEEHCKHVRELLEPEGVDEADILSIISHGYGLCTEERAPETNMEKSLFTVDELTGIVMTTALMRPTGIADMELKSLKKKFKDKGFAAKCNRDVIKQGFEMLGVEPDVVMQCCIDGMRDHMDALGIGPKE
ncbi:MAG: hypothetical protein PHC80_09125 [Eubacteriales bacterium]|nr:hypothetical protein [Eubacteriales bacterium]